MATGVAREAKLSRTRSVEALRIRERSEELEARTLSENATRSAGGDRERPEAPSPTRMAFAVDRDRIVHSKAFRRLKHKTQVFLAPVGDHYRTRLTHTLEVTHLGRSLGRDRAERLDTMIYDVIVTSYGKRDVTMSDEVLEATNALRKFMFDNVYLAGPAKTEDRKAQGVLWELLQYFEKQPELLPPEHQRIAKTDGTKRAVADYVASMTDRYALDTFASIFIPTVWSHL